MFQVQHTIEHLKHREKDPNHNQYIHFEFLKLYFVADFPCEYAEVCFFCLIVLENQTKASVRLSARMNFEYLKINTYSFDT